MAQLLIRGARSLSSGSSSGVKFEILDVFARQRFGGNQLAVCYDEHGTLSSEDMLSITKEYAITGHCY